MSAQSFFTENRLPVFEHLSADSKRQLEGYLSDGNTAFRQKKLLEFFKTIDWIAPDEPCDSRPLQKLTPMLQRQLRREIEDYRMQKALDRAESAEKREQYRLRVFEYFRIKMPSADKALLESLRDYELNLTGRDVNWRHYFTLDSFKKIDEFIQSDPATRQALFARFKQDVDTYKKNYDKIHNPQYHQPCNHTLSFDEWCDLMGDEIPHRRSRSHAGNRQQQQSRPGLNINNPVYQAYQTMQLGWNAPPEAVKKQFRKLTLSYHPDLPNGSEEKMKALVGAYHEIQRYWHQSAQAR